MPDLLALGVSVGEERLPAHQTFLPPADMPDDPTLHPARCKLQVEKQLRGVPFPECRESATSATRANRGWAAKDLYARPEVRNPLRLLPPQAGFHLRIGAKQDLLLLVIEAGAFVNKIHARDLELDLPESSVTMGSDLGGRDDIRRRYALGAAERREEMDDPLCCKAILPVVVDDVVPDERSLRLFNPHRPRGALHARGDPPAPMGR